jgi:hypothetical protein
MRIVLLTNCTVKALVPEMGGTADAIREEPALANPSSSKNRNLTATVAASTDAMTRTLGLLSSSRRLNNARKTA